MNSSKEEIVSVRDLSKLYGPNEALRNINLSVNKDSVLGLIGLNGSGKPHYRVHAGHAKPR